MEFKRLVGIVVLLVVCVRVVDGAACTLDCTYNAATLGWGTTAFADTATALNVAACATITVNQCTVSPFHYVLYNYVFNRAVTLAGNGGQARTSIKIRGLGNSFSSGAGPITIQHLTFEVDPAIRDTNVHIPSYAWNSPNNAVTPHVTLDMTTISDIGASNWGNVWSLRSSSAWIAPDTRSFFSLTLQNPATATSLLSSYTITDCVFTPDNPEYTGPWAGPVTADVYSAYPPVYTDNWNLTQEWPNPVSKWFPIAIQVSIGNNAGLTYGVRNWVISACQFTGMFIGIYLAEPSGTLTINGNTFTDGDGWDIFLMDPTNATVTNNVITNSVSTVKPRRKKASIDIRQNEPYATQMLTITGNTLTNNFVGTSATAPTLSPVMSTPYPAISITGLLYASISPFVVTGNSITGAYTAGIQTDYMNCVRDILPSAASWAPSNTCGSAQSLVQNVRKMNPTITLSPVAGTVGTYITSHNVVNSPSASVNVMAANTNNWCDGIAVC
eukprot:gnl/Spiro4/4798_TR2402_c0_g1_i1.p1 gnl/Spiro4/4798_TR2402_c0_g1~~gnl/Spiro4/4798_TR2402_c0_g1_i1.p1  ORF type:complete len:499 (-),score=76.95 gnl/Spiro4/4798_TR2402_c0_g1_i1:38-1534(-)